jgi:hypothetical protein
MRLNDCGCGNQQALAGLGQASEAGAVTTTEAAAGFSWPRSIGLGVATGLTVWLITRFLDGKFTSKRRVVRRTTRIIRRRARR